LRQIGQGVLELFSDIGKTEIYIHVFSSRPNGWIGYIYRNQVFTKSGKGSCAFLKPEHVTGTPISEAPTLVTGETVPPTWSSTETASLI